MDTPDSPDDIAADHASRIEAYFRAVDSFDAEEVKTKFVPWPTYQFASDPADHDLEAIAGRVARMSGRVKSIRHRVVDLHHDTTGAVAFAQLEVDYVALDGTELHNPALAMFRFDDAGRIELYRTYIDLTPLAAVFG